jgi:hypothetical protein
MVLEEQSDIFCIFHDGNFINFNQLHADIEFTVEIQFLARLINPAFTCFKGLLQNCAKLEYHVKDREQKTIWIIDDLDNLGLLRLEIAYAEFMDKHIAIGCYSHDEGYNGDLVIYTENIIIYDEMGREVTLNKLDEICNLGWGMNNEN